MDKMIDPLRVLNWLAARIVAPHWAIASTVLVGELGARAIRARSFVNGVTIAMTLDRPPDRAAEACLLLAATPEVSDDSLYLAESQLWLLRRYPVSLTETELDLLFKQQLALAALLALSSGADAVPLPIAGRYA
ncbi:protein EsaB [Caballeronia sp. EK]|uniref:protein EsaB n=1 Tax=Caballeronia sp. EK TaxID=2767469 RepID=UPI00165649D2|nr:protein EsaB [Caballeronia sp. EK]MBC8642809.1 protein EsaB [Caballeronia sp. EK]